MSSLFICSKLFSFFTESKEHEKSRRIKKLHLMLMVFCSFLWGKNCFLFFKIKMALVLVMIIF